MSLDALLRRARDQRPPGSPVEPTAPRSGPATYAIALTSLLELARSLADGDADTPATPYGSVRRMLGHLLAVERDLGDALEHGRRIDREHTAAALHDDGAIELADLVGQLAHEHERNLERIAAAAPSTVLDLYGVSFPLDEWCVVRAFEVWTHDEDIRRALGLPLPPVDGGQLAAMTSVAVALVPLVLDQDAIALRLVLTGDGGGVFDVGPGAPGPAPALPPGERPTVVVDTTALCRLAARRVEVDELDAVVDGPDDVLAAVARALGCIRRLSLD